MRHITFLLPVLAVACGGRPAPIMAPEPGDRVRVTAPDVGINKHTGQLKAMGADTLTVDTLRVAVASVTRLEVQRGRKSWGAGKGALVGLGAAVPFLVVAVAIPDCGSNAGCFDDWFAMGAVILFPAIGAITGALVKTDRWEELPLDQLRVSFVPQRDGRFAFGLSVAF